MIKRLAGCIRQYKRDTSVVKRVTRDDVEKRSIFENEKSCTL